jgi:hypothetical protein
VLRYLDEDDWEFVATSWLTYDGPVRALELAYRSIDEGVHETRARRFVADTFLELGQTELAMMWAETSGASKQLAIRIQLGQGEYDAALRLIAQSENEVPDEAVLRYAAQLIPIPTGPEVVQASRDRYCRSPVEKPRFRACWRVDAVIAESQGDLERAETILGRINRRLADPRPLARFYARQRLCRELGRLAADETRSDFRKQLEQQLEKCGRR